MKTIARSLSVLIVASFFNYASAAPPELINYQGRLLNKAGETFSGSITVLVRVYDAANPVAALYSEAHAAVSVDDGEFSLHLGAGTSKSGVLDAQSLSVGASTLEIQIDEHILSPRIPLLSVPYAMHATVTQQVGTYDDQRLLAIKERLGTVESLLHSLRGE